MKTEFEKQNEHAINKQKMDEALLDPNAGPVPLLLNGNESVPIPWSDFDKQKFPEIKWRIKNLIPSEGFVIVASPSGEKKTWLVMHMAKCIATGKNCLDNEEFFVDKGKVLYIDQENSRAEIQRRGRLLGLPEGGENIWLFSHDSFDLSDDRCLEWLDVFIKQNSINVVVIDTLRAVAGGLKEDKAEEVRAFLNRFLVYKNKGVTFVFIDHCRKPSANEGKTPKKEQLLASQDKVASSEVLIMLRSDDGSDEVKVYQRKNRLHKEIPPFRFLMEDAMDPDKEGVEVESINLKYDGLIDDEDTAKDEAKETIIELLEEKGMTRQELLKAVKGIKKIGNRNTSDALRELESSGILHMEKKGRENFYDLKTTEDEQF